MRLLRKNIERLVNDNVRLPANADIREMHLRRINVLSIVIDQLHLKGKNILNASNEKNNSVERADALNLASEQHWLPPWAARGNFPRGWADRPLQLLQKVNARRTAK